MKFGRNDPCHCGSGKKYKKCHLDSDTRRPTEKDIGEVIEHFRKEQEKQQALEAGGYYLPHFQSLYQGKRVRAVGSRLFHSLPPKQTFHEFILVALATELGKKWAEDQRTLPDSERHFITKCYSHFDDWKRRNATEKNRYEQKWAGVPDGWTRSLMALAFDVYCIKHRANPLPRLLNRLKNKDQYQGARYEIAIAAIFTRLGFTIEFLDKENPKAPHCEFVATHQEKGVSIVVEAKSCHWSGVLHQKERGDPDASLKDKIRAHIEDAISQNPGTMPFMIFIDLNTPLTPGVDFPSKPWFLDIQKNVGVLGPNDPDNPAPENAIFFTNFSFHYQTDQEADPAEYLAVFPTHPKHPLQDKKILELLDRGLTHYGEVPNLE